MSYSNYPICNLRQSQAMAYCQWLSARLSAFSGKEIVISLPTETEWIQDASYEREDSKSFYKPSVNPYWRNAKGVYIANHVGYRTSEQLTKYQDLVMRKNKMGLSKKLRLSRSTMLKLVSIGQIKTQTLKTGVIFILLPLVSKRFNRAQQRIFSIYAYF